jgi:Ca2+-binding RTX toxin-like protein
MNVISGATDASVLPITVDRYDPLYVLSTGSIFGTGTTVPSVIVTSGDSASINIAGEVYMALGTDITANNYSTVTIQTTGLIGGDAGVYLTQNSSLTNAGTIQTISVGVTVSNSTIVNTGTISSDYNCGIFAQGGRVVITNSGVVSSGIGENAGFGQVTDFNLQNSGTISQNYNYQLYSGGAVQLVSGTSHIANSGLIQGYFDGIYLSSGFGYAATLYLDNSGTIMGNYAGLDVNIGMATVVDVQNSGYITGSAFQAIFVSDKNIVQTAASTVSISNEQGGVISSSTDNAIFAKLTFGQISLTNAGTISAPAKDVGADSGTVHFDGASNIQNSGLIAATDIVSGVAINVQGTTGTVITNSGTISGVTALDLTDAADRVTNSGTIIGTVFLGDGNDTLVGTGGHVQGTVYGGAGNDLFILSDPLAVVNEAAGQGQDTVQASVDFTLAAGQEIEVLQLTGTALRGSGNEFANTVNGNDQDNVLSGLAGVDTLTGGLGNDTLNGGSENDSLSGGDDNDMLVGFSGNDLLNGDNGDDQLYGQISNDTLNGGAGNDTLNGGLGTDTLNGGDGDDVLIGGKGRDSMNGGNDDDTFVFQKITDTGLVSAATNDIITGFTKGADVIDLSGIDANSGTAANEAFVFLGAGAFSHVAGQLHYVVSGANILLEGDVNGDAVADFQIQLNTMTSIGLGDLVL